MLLFAASDTYVPDLAREMNVWQYHGLRAAVILIPMIGIILALRAGPLWPRRPPVVFTRSALAISALVLYFAAIPAVGVPLAAAGLFTSPVFVVVFSVLIWREPIGIRRLLGVAVGFAGVCLVLQIGQQPLRLMAVVPMVGGALYALSVIWTRRYCQGESAGTLALWNMTVFLIIGSLGMAATPLLAQTVGHLPGTAFATRALAWPSAYAMWLIGAMGIAAAIGMVLLAWAYRTLESSYAALFDYSFLLWAPLFAWLVHGDVVAPGVAIGMALIVCAGALAASGLGRQAQAE